MTPRSTRRPAHVRAARAVGVIATFALVALAAAPAAAGIHYRSVTRTEVEGQKPQTIGAEGWIDGDNAKIEFRESANPITPAGSYLLTRDGGRTVLLVNPEEKTYAEWDVEAMLAGLGGMLQAMGPMLNLEVSDVAVEKLLEEPGETIHGLATTHFRYRTTYSMTVKVIGIRNASSVDQVEDLWVTGALDDLGLGLWLRKAPKTGFEQLDKLIEAEIGKVQGVPLKMTSTSTSTGEKGKRSSVTRMSMEVTELERAVAIPPATFELPAGYTRTEMMVPGAQGEQEEEGRNPLRRIFRGGGDG